MKAKELAKLSIKELLNKEKEIRKEILDLRFKKKIEGLKDKMMIRKKRKELARVLTIIRQKKLRGES
ncbi:50S ribosomal protein L29 [Thermocrinis sp.]|uniref:50S ribosomal protein L29 n=1 Tax=Thermocrinis sp. TaxID=2024383 RepID=UPI002FDDDE4B